MYLPRYLAQDDAVLGRTDDEIREVFVAALERMYPHFTAGRGARVPGLAGAGGARGLDAQLHGRAPAAARDVAAEHVFIVNSAQIANGTLNVNETIGLANSQAAQL